MNKKKKWIIISIVIFVLIVSGLGIFLGIKSCNNEFRYDIKDTLKNGHGKKAKVIILAGQSNASGCSSDEYLKKNVSSEKYTEYDNGYNNVFINYFVSEANKSEAFVKCSTRQGEFGTCFGPELGLAEYLSKNYPDELFFIIKWAWGGTNLYEQWLSPSSSGKTGDLYNGFVKYVDINLRYLQSKDYNIKVEGICWMQGESDSFFVETATNYKDNLLNFIKDLRGKFNKYASDDGIALIDATIADNPMYWVYCDLVNKSKIKVAESSEINVLIDTNKEGLTVNLEPVDNPDMAHYDSLSEIKLGNLFGEYVSKFFN